MRPAGSPAQLIHRAHLYEQWATMLSAGVSMERSLTVLAQSASFRRSRRTLKHLVTEIGRGSSVTEALEASRARIPALDRAVIAVGERTGRLETSLQLLATSCQESAVLLREMIGGMIYPLVILHVALLVFPVSLIQSVVLEGDFTPFLIQKLRVFGILYGVVFLFWLGTPRLFGGGLKALAEMIIRPIPVLGRGLREMALARLAFALDVQLSAGIGAIEAWALAGDVCGSPAVRREIRSWPTALEQGATPGELMGKSRILGGLFSEFYRTGEHTGRLEDALRQIRSYYEREGRARLKAVSEWVPRMVYFGILLYAAYSVISFWTNYFDSMGL